MSKPQRRMSFTMDQFRRLNEIEARIYAAGGEPKASNPFNDDAAIHLHDLLEQARELERSKQRAVHEQSRTATTTG